QDTRRAESADRFQQACTDRRSRFARNLLRDDGTHERVEVVAVDLERARADVANQRFQNGISARQMAASFLKQVCIHEVDPRDTAIFRSTSFYHGDQMHTSRASAARCGKPRDEVLRIPGMRRSQGFASTLTPGRLMLNGSGYATSRDRSDCGGTTSVR